MQSYGNSMSDQTNHLSHQSFLLALLLTLLIAFASYVAFELGILSQIIVDDSTYISMVILTLFVLTLCHCVWRGWVISRQSDMLFSLRVSAGVSNSTLRQFPRGVSYAQDYLVSSFEHTSSGKVSKADVDSEVLAEKLRGPNQIGWFCVGLMIKFGLLGTVIGFAIMLSSVNSLEALEVSDIKNLMQQMTQGMRVAMNTTILGLISSMLLGLQYLILDRFADGLIVEILEEQAVAKR